MAGHVLPAARRVARVLVDSPLPQLDRLFDYRIPEELSETALPGVRVTVPFRAGKRTVAGYLVEVGAVTDFDGELSPLDGVVSPIPVLTPEVWRLARAVADRSAGVASDVLRLAVPPRQVRVEKTHLARAAAREVVPAVEPVEVHEPVEAHEPVDAGEPAADPPVADAPADPPAGPPADPPAEGADAALLAALVDGGRLALVAPGGVRRAGGSDDETDDADWVGAWAVLYARLAAGVLASGRSVIVVVPDHRDLDQLLRALQPLVAAEDLVRVDARQANPERYRGFLRSLDARPAVVVGNRSAVYAPAARLGAILLWDDGDPLHAEPLAPYVHARDAALVRQEQAGCGLLIAGHARSVATQRLVALGWFTEYAPARATPSRVVPAAAVDDADEAASRARIPSFAWKVARDALASGPVLVQVARPGYARTLVCGTCSHVARCRRCDGPLQMTSRNAPPSCAWCGHLAAAWACADCGGGRIRMARIGAGRTAEELGRAFPGVRVVLADGEHPHLTVPAEPALVVATRGAEPLAPGGYRAVLLLDGESLTARESLHVAEDCLRWWSNAIALAAPGAISVLAGVEGELASALVTGGVAAFAAAELAERRPLRFPPTIRTATVTGAPDAVETGLAGIRDLGGVDILGPVAIETDGAAAPADAAAPVRAIVRTDYQSAAELSRRLKAAAVAAATRRAPRPARGGPPRAAPAPLRVRFDDPDVF